MTTVPYDLLLRGGHVIDPASGHDGVADIAIKDGRIAAVREDLLPATAREMFDLRGRIVIPGMITPMRTSTPMSPAVSACRPTWWASRAASRRWSTRAARPA